MYDSDLLIVTEQVQSMKAQSSTPNFSGFYTYRDCKLQYLLNHLLIS